LWRFENAVFFRLPLLPPSTTKHLLLFFLRLVGRRVFFPLAAGGIKVLSDAASF
jgi:hypothetical protein